jgi:hypothetical protein
MNPLTIILQMLTLGLLCKITKTQRKQSMAIEDIQASEATTAAALNTISDAVTNIAADEKTLSDRIAALEATTVTPEQLAEIQTLAADNATKAQAAADALTNLASQVE